MAAAKWQLVNSAKKRGKQTTNKGQNRKPKKSENEQKVRKWSKTCGNKQKKSENDWGVFVALVFGH